MTKNIKAAAVLACAFLTVFARPAAACSAAIIAGGASADGRPVLWKNRDTADNPLNKVIFADEKPYSYMGVVNSGDDSGRRVWAGLNSAGFAIINTVAYNIPLAEGEARDLEGWIMGDALRSCRSADEFEAYLRKNLGKHLGTQANFGVIDAAGGAALFEAHNNGYKRFDAAALPENYLLVTNYSRSGKPDQGKGYIRFDRLAALFRSVKGGKYPLPLLQEFSRDLGSGLLAPGLSADALVPDASPYFVHTNHTLDRASTASSAFMQGVRKDQRPGDAVLWVALGEPVCGIAVPLWVETGSVPEELGGGATAPLAAEAARLKALLRPYKDSERAEYLDLYRLRNAAGTGWLNELLKAEREISARTALFLSSGPDLVRKAAFQKEMAARALAALKKLK